MEEYRDARDLFRTLLCLSEPWEVESVLTEGNEEIHVRVGVPFSAEVPCPVCGNGCKAHDRLRDRVWRDADIIGRTTYVHARIPRSYCPVHGVRQIDVPWARENSRFTLIKNRARGYRNADNLIAMCYVMADQRRTDLYGRRI